MKKVITLLIVAMFLGACGSGSPEPDYTADEFEKALNDGEDLTGKLVEVEIRDYEPASAFGYNLIAGEHLNFVSDGNPGLKAGDEFIAEVEEVENVLGSFIITYKKK